MRVLDFVECHKDGRRGGAQFGKETFQIKKSGGGRLCKDPLMMPVNALVQMFAAGPLDGDAALVRQSQDFFRPVRPFGDPELMERPLAGAEGLQNRTPPVNKLGH